METEDADRSALGLLDMSDRDTNASAYKARQGKFETIS